jgi:hypothetical protein
MRCQKCNQVRRLVPELLQHTDLPGCQECMERSRARHLWESATEYRQTKTRRSFVWLCVGSPLSDVWRDRLVLDCFHRSSDYERCSLNLIWGRNHIGLYIIAWSSLKTTVFIWTFVWPCFSFFFHASVVAQTGRYCCCYIDLRLIRSLLLHVIVLSPGFTTQSRSKVY